MRCAVYYNNRDVRIEERPLPEISDDELLFKVMACGICGSDVLEWYRVKKAPLVLGHEATGEIAKVGSKVKNYKTGDRVFIAHHVPCNTCRYCLGGNHTVCEMLHTTNYFPGGFSEYVRVPAANVERGVFLLPDSMSFDEGTFIEPVACVLRGQRMMRLDPDDTLLILGAGISGLLHLMTARAKGLKNIIVTDVFANRLDCAKKLGATCVINAKEDLPKNLRSNNGDRLADAVIICTGAYQAFLQALQCVDRAGTVMCFAATDPGVTLPVPVNDFWRQSIKIMHSYGASPDDTVESIKLISSGKLALEEMITHRLGLGDTGLGFKLVAEARDCIKVIIHPQQN